MRDQLLEPLAEADVETVCATHGIGIILLTEDARVVGVSEPVSECLEENRWPLTIDEHRYLQLQDSAKQEQLLKRLRQIKSGELNVVGLVLNRGEDLPIALRVLRSAQTPYLLLSIRDLSLASAGDEALLRDVFAFTRREAQLSSHLARGQSLLEFTEKCSLTNNTAKSHLRSVYKKVGVHSQRELVAVVLGVLR